MVDIREVWVETFVTQVQTMLVAYFREKYGDECADCCCDFWTGACGRVCLAYSLYAGCKNMGVQVSWRDIKGTCSAGSSLAQFIGALCKFINTVLGEEHMQRLLEAGNPNAFIGDQQPSGNLDH